jgi:uncharacterized protein
LGRGLYCLGDWGVPMTTLVSGTTRNTPVAKADRIDSLDILRGIAVFGILMMNISAFGLIFQGYYNPYASGGTSELNLFAFKVMNVGFEGTMRGIFSMLFGAGIVLMTERMEQAGAGLTTAEIHFRRMTWLMIFGIIHWTLLLWTGEILFAYSMCGFLLFALRKLPAKLQLGMGITALLIASAIYNQEYRELVELEGQVEAASAIVAVGGKLDDQQTMALETWNAKSLEMVPTPESTAMFESWHNGSYWEAVTGQYPFSYDFQWTHAPFWYFFDMIPFMLIGMALLKWGVLAAHLPAKFYLGMMASGYAIGIPLGLYEYGILVSGDFGPVAVAQANQTYEISRLAMVAGHIGLVFVLIKLDVFKLLQRGLAASGQMALTNYLTQTMICTTLFYSFGLGLGLYNELTRIELYTIWAVIIAVQTCWSVLWLRYFRFGPFEWLWRSLTYWQLQPMRKGRDGLAPGQILGAT